MSKRVLLLLLATIFVLILIILIIVNSLTKNITTQPAQNGTNGNLPTNNITITINGKNIKNPTFSNIGFGMPAGPAYNVIAKIVKVEKTDSEVTANIQSDESKNSIRKVLFYKNAIIYPHYLINSDDYPATGLTETGFDLNSLNSTYNKLSGLINNNIYLYVETENQGISKINGYLPCNKLWINLLKSKNHAQLNCVPVVWEFVVSPNE